MTRMHQVRVTLMSTGTTVTKTVSVPWKIACAAREIKVAKLSIAITRDIFTI